MILHAYQKNHPIEIFTTLEGLTLNSIKTILHIPFNSFTVHLPSIEGKECIKTDDAYFQLLNFVNDNIPSRSYVHIGKTLRPEIQTWLPKDEKLIYYPPNTRANNLTVSEKKTFIRKWGELYCERALHHNIVLPNGDVFLCCMDYGLEHRLGNLLEMNYEDLFKGSEMTRIQKGLKDQKTEILCRYCEWFAKEKNYIFYLTNKIRNKIVR